MSTDRKRLAMIAGTTMALVLSGATIVTAQTDTVTQSPQQVQLNGDAGMGGVLAHGGDMGGRGRGGRGFGGDLDGGLRGAIADRFEDIVSHTVVRLDADGNVLTSKVEHGTVSAVADGSITIDLATGESVTIATDANTSAYSWSTDTRPARTEVALADIAAGADVVVWSQSQDDGSFLAQRVAVLPVTTTTDDGTIPEASPAAVG